MAQAAHWTVLGEKKLAVSPFLIVGIVNVTPDSFYDGGNFSTTQAAVAHCQALIEQGADIVDIGGESTRPYATPVSMAQEQQRVLPVVAGAVEMIRQRQEKAVLSVDTYNGETARMALEAGASVINDISACRFDPELPDIIAQYKPGYVLMHSPGRPASMQEQAVYTDVLDEVKAFFVRQLRLLTEAGLPEDRIVLDPGIGFGKTAQHNIELLRGIETFFELGFPVFIGISNKSIMKDLLDLDKAERGNATQALTALLAQRGVHIHRVHDVVATKETLTIADIFHA